MRVCKCLYFPNFLTDLAEIWDSVLFWEADTDKQIKFDIFENLEKQICFAPKVTLRNCLYPENGLLQVKYFYAFQ